MACCRLRFESLIALLCIHVDTACGAFCANPPRVFTLVYSELGRVYRPRGWGLLGRRKQAQPGCWRGLRQHGSRREGVCTWNASTLQGFGFLRGGLFSGRLVPSPSPEQSSPCVLRGRERKGGESYFSKLLSSCSLPCDSRRGREDGEGAGSGDFPECRDKNESQVWLPFLFLRRSIFSAS